MTIREACKDIYAECDIPNDRPYKFEVVVSYDCPTDDFEETSFDIAEHPRCRGFETKLEELWREFCKEFNIRLNCVKAVVITNCLGGKQYDTSF